MLTIDVDEPPATTRCECCGGTTTRLTRFVNRDGDAFAVYYAMFSDDHPEREILLAVGLGDWDDEAPPEDRRAFALVMRSGEEAYEVTVVDAAESPWRDSAILGRMLDRDEALAHPWIEDVFHITDHMVKDDPAIKSYFEDARWSAPKGIKLGVRSG
ncbi:MAG: hypothetical protein LC795_20370 [Acidobacteria bacterium]|nr:hypothetical protein [Acidobacteriota bacterium]